MNSWTNDRAVEKPKKAALTSQQAGELGRVIQRAVASALTSLVTDGGPAIAGEPSKAPPAAVNGSGKAEPDEKPADFERLYRRIKDRLLDELPIDPVLIHLVTQRPELIVEVERQTETLIGSTLRGRVARLIAAGWFGSPRATGAARKELARTGADPGGGGALSDALSAFVRDGYLTREGDGYQIAPGVKITEREIQTRS